MPCAPPAYASVAVSGIQQAAASCISRSTGDSCAALLIPVGGERADVW